MINRERLRKGRIEISSELAKKKEPVDMIVARRTSPPWERKCARSMRPARTTFIST